MIGQTLCLPKGSPGIVKMSSSWVVPQMHGDLASTGGKYMVCDAGKYYCSVGVRSCLFRYTIASHSSDCLSYSSGRSSAVTSLAKVQCVVTMRSQTPYPTTQASSTTKLDVRPCGRPKYSRGESRKCVTTSPSRSATVGSKQNLL